MAKSNSAAKRERQNEKRRMRNRETKSAVRTAIKKFQAAVLLNDAELAKERLTLAVKLVDTAAGKGVFHRNNAARKKSRMYAKYNALIKTEEAV